MITPLSTLKRWFSNFMKPNQEHFWAIFDSFRHKSEKVPMEDIDGLTTALEGTASAEQLQNHLRDSHAHSGLFDRKVDKEAGKTLTSNDYTNEEKHTNQVNAQKRVVGLTVTGDVDKIITITFADSTVLQAPFTDNNTLPENLADIKLNSLNFNNQTGVLTGLRSDGQQLTVNLDGRYALKGHTHHWDDIEGKPSLNYLPLVGGTLTGNVVLTNQAIFKKGNPISGYIVDCFAANNNTSNKTNPIYVIGENYKPTDDALATMYGIGYTTNNAKFINGEDLGFPAVNGISGWGLYIAAVGKARHFLDANTGNSYQFGDSRANGFIKKGSSNDYILLGGGGHKKLSDIEPTNISASNNIICNHSHNNSVIFVENNLAIQLKDLAHLDCVSFRKVYAGGAVTFSCAGKTIIYTGDNAFNGGDGSTAVVSIYGNKCYIDIRNV